jgi:peptidoglycan pentaglycine glycine transferase (the first glycine)
MKQLSIEKCDSQAKWDDYVLNNGGHPLQLWGWGETKARHNWQTERVFIYKNSELIGGAQLLIRRLPSLFKNLVYIPRGPVVERAEDREKVLTALTDYVKTTFKAVALTTEPDWTAFPVLKEWKRSLNTILIPRTLILDLTRSDDELLANMAKKTRQYIRKSSQEQLILRRVTDKKDVAACLEVYKLTAKRAGFDLHNDTYYYDIFEQLTNHSYLFAAFSGSYPIAFLWLVASKTTAFELYGGMNDEGQQLRANYALKWYAIQSMKQAGVERYDFNGLLNDGVSTFKQGFAQHEDMLAGTYDRPLSPLYPAWAHGLPAAKKILRTLRPKSH